jgi:hypothetical protein
MSERIKPKITTTKLPRRELLILGGAALYSLGLHQLASAPKAEAPGITAKRPPKR